MQEGVADAPTSKHSLVPCILQNLDDFDRRIKFRYLMDWLQPLTAHHIRIMQVAMDFVSPLNIRLNKKLESFAFSHTGWTALTVPRSIDFYRDWIKQGHHATMSYLERHLEAKANPNLLTPQARSAIVVAKAYQPHPYPATETESFTPRIALYAKGEDYHRRFLQELEELARALKQEFIEDEFLCFTDSAPILERDLAERAGLGWIGKNSCLIHPKKGSLFLLGEILTTLDLTSASNSIPDMCGTCDRCLRACPTQAFEAPRTLNANKCIAYWTIEAREAAPVELREKFGDWFFGCDICQTVCPWNEKVFGRGFMQKLTETPQPHSTTLVEDLRGILSTTNRDLRERYDNVPLIRSRALGLKRNALYVIGNLKLKELLPEVHEAALNTDLNELALWAINLLTE